MSERELEQTSPEGSPAGRMPAAQPQFSAPPTDGDMPVAREADESSSLLNESSPSASDPEQVRSRPAPGDFDTALLASEPATAERVPAEESAKIGELPADSLEGSGDEIDQDDDAVDETDDDHEDAEEHLDDLEESGDDQDTPDRQKAEEVAVEAPKAEVKHAWYVVHCYSGYENKVKKSLEQHIISDGMQDRIYRVVVPVEKEVEIKEGQRKNIERRVFPGYILVEMMELHEGDPVSDQAWYVVRNTPGVTGFVSSGDKPVPLRQDEVDKILKRMETAEPKVHVTFKSGQTVHIIDGPFADFRGTVDEVSMEKGKVRVMVSFFGRETPVELDLLQVEKV